MSKTEDAVEFDDPEAGAGTAGSIDVDEIEDGEPTDDGWRSKLEQVKNPRGWPGWAKGLGGAAALLVLLNGCGAVASAIGGSDETSTNEEAEEVVPESPTDPLDGLPELNPIVAAFLRTSDLTSFSNHVRQLTADGTSVCDVYFGVTQKRDGNGNPSHWSWMMTTPAVEARNAGERGGIGVKLPSSEFPTVAFYGSPCSVSDADEYLPGTFAETTNNRAPAESAVASTTTTAPAPAEPVSPVSVPGA